MGRDGLVRRRRVGNDQRSVAVCLTPAGRALAEKVAPLAEANERVALAGFDEDEARTLKALLRRVAENVEGQENASTQYDAPAPHFAS
jgi:DNA-binding MarR family transcriptional regulator